MDGGGAEYGFAKRFMPAGANSPLKNAIVAFFNPRQVRSTARKMPILIVILPSHPCDDAAS